PYYRTLFNEARAQLREALVKECGTTIVECAASTGKDDPYRDPAMHTFYRFTMTYNLPQQNRITVRYSTKLALNCVRRW
ncbi:hypothetical protein K6T53_25535, partial [Escherichia coli]|nr:hypothetical protein [Escherichia coli]